MCGRWKLTSHVPAAKAKLVKINWILENGIKGVV